MFINKLGNHSSEDDQQKLTPLLMMYMLGYDAKAIKREKSHSSHQGATPKNAREGNITLDDSFLPNYESRKWTKMSTSVNTPQGV